MRFEILNGNPKCTVIESFYGEVAVIRPGSRFEFETLKEAKGFVEAMGWEINVDFIKGSPILRRMN